MNDGDPEYHERLQVDPVGIAIVVAMLVGVALVFAYDRWERARAPRACVERGGAWVVSRDGAEGECMGRERVP